MHSPYSQNSLQTALLKQRESIPYFSTKDRLNLIMDKFSENLIIYDWQENQFYIASFQNGQTIFTPLTGGGSNTRLITNFSLQTIVSVNHNFGYYPTVQIFDSAGLQIDGSVQNLNINQTVIILSEPISGYVITF